ncbi:MAG TPA: TolC family protein [Pyrinomonadaceae bacterium]|nr:TolC family protein [Pyrinomonadaceae bacterium]
MCRPKNKTLIERKTLWRMILPIFFAVVFAIPISAQNVFPPILTLEKAVETAVQNNPQTRMTEAGIKLAEAKIAEAKTGKSPFVNFSQNVMRSNNPVFVFGSLLEQGRFGAANFAIDKLNHPSGLNNFRSLVSVQKPLFDQHQTRSHVTQANFGKQQAELQAEFVRQNLRFGVIKQFYGTILAQEQVKVTTEAVKAAEANRKKTRDLADVGMTTEADFLAAEVELANAEQQKLEAESDRIVSLSALNITLGEKPDFQYEINTNLQEKFFQVEDQDELLKLALENRADFQKTKLAVEQSKEQTKSVINTKLPRVDVFGNYGYSSPYIANGSSDYTVGISLNYTLYDAGRKARIEQTTSAEMLAEAQKDDLANQIRLEVIKSYQNYQTSRAKIQVSVKAIAQAEEVLRIVQDRYKFGVSTITEVLRAETALVRAKQNLLSARHDYYIAYAAILLATGRLTDVRFFN